MRRGVRVNRRESNVLLVLAVIVGHCPVSPAPCENVFSSCRPSDQPLNHLELLLPKFGIIVPPFLLRMNLHLLAEYISLDNDAYKHVDVGMIILVMVMIYPFSPKQHDSSSIGLLRLFFWRICIIRETDRIIKALDVEAVVHHMDRALDRSLNVGNIPGWSKQAMIRRQEKGPRSWHYTLEYQDNDSNGARASVLFAFQKTPHVMMQAFLAPPCDTQYALPNVTAFAKQTRRCVHWDAQHDIKSSSSLWPYNQCSAVGRTIERMDCLVWIIPARVDLARCSIVSQPYSHFWCPRFPRR
jgi:hypothetical protein